MCGMGERECKVTPRFLATGRMKKRNSNRKQQHVKKADMK